MKKHQGMILCLFAVLLYTISPVGAIKGTDVWEVDGYIVYEVDLYQDWNYDYYPNEDPFTNYDIEGVKMTETYTELDRDEMEFERSTSSRALEAWWDTLDYDDTYDVDPNTGLDDDGYWTGAFLDTSDFTDGCEIPDLDFLIEYEDDSGVHSTSKKRTVFGDKRTIEVEVDGKTEEIDIWDIGVLDFSYNFTLQGNEFRISYLDTRDRVTDVNGVCVGVTTIQELEILEDDRYVLLVTIQYESKAIEINGVKVKAASSTIPGFEFGILGFLLLLTYGYRRRN
ncbi:MAG: hypothetical protein JSW11_14960 [Candidatus Heimdallarchaeota archaeon]|nr:MAG: hypothetical protein JSW11_14960 [Candidatus Heimdallarchaeota archaeon]